MKFVKVLFVTGFCLLLLQQMAAARWKIEVQVDGFVGDALYLAYYLGPSQYILDTARRSGDLFTVTGEEPLKAGMYLVVLPPDNKFFQLPLDGSETDVHIQVAIDNIQIPYDIRGSEEAKRFYEYIDFLGARRSQAEEIRDQLSGSRPRVKDRLQSDLDAIDTEVRAFQQSVIQNHPMSLTALIIKASKEPERSDFEGSEEEKQHRLYEFYKRHYFDQVPMGDDRIVRLPILNQKIDYYMQKLTPQIPDSIAKSIDFILGKFNPQGEPFKIYLAHFLNHYAKSNIIGMDAVYVHLVDNYYAKGLAPWTDDEQLEKIISDAARMKPLLIGKIAPDLRVEDREGNMVRLHDVDAEYTIMFFWDPDCGHCKKSLPKLIEFYDTYKPRGIEIFAICTRIQENVPKCWESVDEHAMGRWINVADPNLRSRFRQIYDIRTTPQIFILDREKKIIMKRIGSEQLPDVMDRFLANGG